jgi:hypothetical protein
MRAFARHKRSVVQLHAVIARVGIGDYLAEIASLAQVPPDKIVETEATFVENGESRPPVARSRKLPLSLAACRT